MFIKCSCGCQALECNSSEELEVTREEAGTEWFLSFWSQGHAEQILNFRSRLRWMWKILCTGMPWTDAIILDYCGMKKLQNYVNKEVTTFEESHKERADQPQLPPTW